MDAVTILEKYNQLTVKEYEVRQEMHQLASSIRDEKLLGKYNVGLDKHSFTIYYITDKGKACLIPLEFLDGIHILSRTIFQITGIRSCLGYFCHTENYNL